MLLAEVIIACAADSIVASPNTITGSIGVFGMIPNLENFYKNKLGITIDTVKTHRSADMGINRALTPFERKKIQKSVTMLFGTAPVRCPTTCQTHVRVRFDWAHQRNGSKKSDFRIFRIFGKCRFWTFSNGIWGLGGFASDGKWQWASNERILNPFRPIWIHFERFSRFQSFWC